MAPIQSIPIELLIRMFTIGCDEYSHESHGIYYTSPLSIPRHTKTFMVPISLVCRHWHEIALDEGSSCFWVTQLRLGPPNFVDAAVEAAAFKQCLVDSKISDIKVLVFAGNGPHMDQHRIYAHVADAEGLRPSNRQAILRI